MHSRRAFAFADELRYVTVVHVYQQTYTYLHAIKSSVKKEREKKNQTVKAVNEKCILQRCFVWRAEK